MLESLIISLRDVYMPIYISVHMYSFIHIYIHTNFAATLFYTQICMCNR
jgi:hypothetical protein